MIIETCPKCGHDLQNEIVCTYPPIPVKHCYHCGWHWEGKREEVIRVPFHENQGEIVSDDCTLLNDCLDNCTSLNACLDLNNTITSDEINKGNIKLC